MAGLSLRPCLPFSRWRSLCCCDATARDKGSCKAQVLTPTSALKMHLSDLRGRISFKRPLEKPQKFHAKAEAGRAAIRCSRPNQPLPVEAKFEPEPEPPQMEAPQHAGLEAGEGGAPQAPAEMRTLNVNRETLE